MQRRRARGLLRAALRKAAAQTARTVAQVATGVQRENLVRTMQAVRGRYGTFEASFEAEHGLDARGLAALRNMYLEQAARGLCARLCRANRAKGRLPPLCINGAPPRTEKENEPCPPPITPPKRAISHPPC